MINATPLSAACDCVKVNALIEFSVCERTPEGEREASESCSRYRVQAAIAFERNARKISFDFRQPPAAPVFNVNCDHFSLLRDRVFLQFAARSIRTFLYSQAALFIPGSGGWYVRRNTTG